MLTDDPTFHVRDFSFDNPGLDLPPDLDDILFKEASLCLPDDIISHCVFEANNYTSGSNGSCALGQNGVSGQGPGIIQGHDHLDQGHRHINGLTDHLKQQLHHQHYHHNHQQRVPTNPHLSSSCQLEGLHSQQQHLHLKQQQQQHQQQQLQTSSYCSISGQPQVCEGYEQPQLSHTSLPDSPPDSGSEPYSPTDGNPHHQAMTDLKSTIPGSLPTLTQSMYPGPGHNRLVGMIPVKAPPAYIGEPSKLNHHHQGPPPSLQQQQDQQQHGQRVPLPYPRSAAMGQHLSSQQMSPPLAHPILPAHMGSMSNIASQANKKRKYSESPTGTMNSSMLPGMNGVLSIKQEPPGAQFSSYIGECSGGDDDLSSYDMDSNSAFMDSTYQVIKWQPYLQLQWAVLTDGDFKDLPTPQYRVDADKGFNFSVPDEAFVCQKKNHFQVTVHMRLHGNAKYIRTMEEIKKIENFYLHFYGVKMESQNQNIKIEQSQSDRSKKLFNPVKIDLPADQETKVTIGRLHFSETTSNNMRKKGKPNPDQRYFLLVVSLHAHSGNKDYMLVGSVSDRIIVRASNPGQFDSDVDVMWQKGQTPESVFHMGRVGVNTDHPEEALTVHGNMRLTGHLTQPSDMRAKQNIEEINPKDQLENVSKLRIYRYTYRDDYAAQAGIPPGGREDAGVLAQEILDVLPDAVQVTGDIVLPNGETIENFLVVNKDRIFMENVGAVKELCKLTDNLEVRIDQLEKMNRRLGKLKRFDSLKSTTSNLSAKSISTISSISSAAPKHNGNNSGRGAIKNTCRNSHNSSGCNGSSLNDSKSIFGSLKSWPFQNKCNNWFRYRYIIVGLILLMAFCLIALACLYILEVRKTDPENGSLSASQQDGGISTTVKSELTLSTVTVSTRFKTEGSTPSSLSVSSSTSGGVVDPAAVTTRGGNSASSLTTITSIRNTEAVPTVHLNENTASSTVATTLGSTTEMMSITISQPAILPVVPPYPPCTEGYCEKLCCPPPHEDKSTNYQIPTGKDTPDDQKADSKSRSGIDMDAETFSEIEPFDTNTLHVLSQPTRSQPKETVVIQNLDHNDPERKDTPYSVVNNLPENFPRYSVISQPDNRFGMHSNNYYRRRRGADDAPRPTVRIIELNYTLGDEFCNGCNKPNYTFYVPYNASFGYSQITLEFHTPTMSYMALCGTSFMWSCPTQTDDDSRIEGHVLQQTNNATWSFKLGSHFKTILTFLIIHSLKGKSVSEPCLLQNNQDYVVMNYTFQFQRQC